MQSAISCKKVEGGKYKIYTYKTVDLSEDEISTIIERVKELYLWFAPSSSEVAIRERLLRHKDTHISILVRTEDNSCRGFSVHYTETLGNLRVIFRDGTVIRDRSRGLYKILLRCSITLDHHDYIVAMTQNPRVYETLRSFSRSGKIFPSNKSDVPDEVREIAAKFCRVPAIALDTLIVSGVYDNIRKDTEFKQPKDAEVKDFFAKKLGDNDGFFVVVPLR